MFISQVVPPKGWEARKGGYENVVVQIPRLAIQRVHAAGCVGIYGVNTTYRTKPMSNLEFEKLAAIHPKPALTEDKMGSAFWKSLQCDNYKVYYGSDVSHTLFDRDCKCWNLRDLGKI